MERFEWLCWIFACSYLHLVEYPLRLPKFVIWAGIVRHRLSANQIVRWFKLKKLENYMRYFLFSLKLQKISCYFGLCRKIFLANRVCRIFYFWLDWFVNFNTGVPLLHCTCLCYRKYYQKLSKLFYIIC